MTSILEAPVQCVITAAQIDNLTFIASFLNNDIIIMYNIAYMRTLFVSSIFELSNNIYNAYANLQKLFDTAFNSFDPGKVAPVNFRSLAIGVFHKIANVLVLPVSQLYGTPFALTGVVVCCHDGLIARMEALHVQAHDCFAENRRVGFQGSISNMFTTPVRTKTLCFCLRYEMITFKEEICVRTVI